MCSEQKSKSKLSPTAGPGQIIANIALVSCVHVPTRPHQPSQTCRPNYTRPHTHPLSTSCLLFYSEASFVSRHTTRRLNTKFLFRYFFFVSPFSLIFHHSNIMDANMRKYSSHATRQRARVRNRRAQALRLLNQLTQPDVSNERWNDII